MPRTTKPIPAAPGGQQEEADLLFRLEMKLANILLGYWKHGLAAVGAVLLIVFFVSLANTHSRDVQRGYAAAIARVDAEVPQPSELSLYGLAPEDDLADEERVSALREGAEKYEAIARDASGPGAVEAWIKAGDTWARLGEQERAIAAFRHGYEADEGGLLNFSSGNRLALLLQQAGKTAEAMEIWRELSTSLEGVLAEEALYRLLRAQHAAGDAEALQKSAAEFKLRFPESQHLPDVERLAASLSRSQEGGA